MIENYERLRKWAQDAASGKTDKIPYIDITDLISEVMKLRAAAPVAEPVTLSLSKDQLRWLQKCLTGGVNNGWISEAAELAIRTSILAASQGASHG